MKATTTNKKRELGEFIRERREELGLTQVEIARRLGYKFANFVTMVERGTNVFPIHRTLDWAEALKMPAETLLQKVIETWHPEFMPYIDIHAGFKTPEKVDPAEMGKTLREFRERAAMTQSELAKTLKMGQNFVAMIENSSANFPINRWAKYAEGT